MSVDAAHIIAASINHLADGLFNIGSAIVTGCAMVAFAWMMKGIGKT